MSAILTREVFEEAIGTLIACRDETGDAAASDLAKAEVLAHDAAMREAARESESLWMEFLVEGLCGLCGNSGITEAIESETPAGRTLYLSPRPCICPNGRAIILWKADR